MIFNKIKKSYGTKLIIIFTLLSMVCVICSSVMLYLLLKDVVYQNYNMVVEDTSNQIYKEIERKMNEIQRVADIFIFDQNFHDTLSKQYEGLERQNILNEYLLTKGNTSLILTDLKLEIKLYVNNTTIPEHYYIRGENAVSPHRRSFEVFHTDRIQDQPYYIDLYNTPNYVIWKQVETDAEDGNISLMAKLTNFPMTVDSGILRVVIRLDDLFKDTIQEDFKQKVYYSILKENGEVLWSNSDNPQFERSDFVSQKALKRTNLTLSLRMPKSNISNGIYKYYIYLALNGAVCFALTYFTALLLKKILYSNITKIVNGIKEFKKGNYNHTIHLSGEDEFSLIASSLNSFAQSTGYLINDVYEVMMQKQDIEIQMLQAKINPHFMYNIFNIISQLSRAGKNDEINQIVRKTAKFYRSTLSKSVADNNLENEIEILNEYFDIIDIQRPNAVERHYYIAKETLACLVPNFILQPIVENAIKHAMVGGHLIITITSKLINDVVEVTVSDNGIGMTKEQLEEAFRFKPSSGYGLYNINERIRLRYSDERYTIKCRSEYQKGTDVILTFPYITQADEGGERYV